MVDKSPTSTNNMRETVLGEIEAHYLRRDTRVELMGIIDCRKLTAYLNNFPFNLPSSMGGTQNEVELSRAKKSRSRDRTAYINLYADMVREESTTPYFERFNLTVESLVAKGHSERFARHTSVTFAHDVKCAIQAAALDEEAVKVVTNKFYSSKRILDKEYKDVILPIYIELRKMGYTYMDLT
ncbi:MAG: hypothetical protein KBC84_07430 [Proteobacteria bacterium]|nr:hypothetical protein [Pseudomonadota bacterium]